MVFAAVHVAVVTVALLTVMPLHPVTDAPATCTEALNDGVLVPLVAYLMLVIVPLVQGHDRA